VRLKFNAIPKKAEARGRGQRPVRLQAEGMASVMHIDQMIEGAIRKKATRYGQLGLPYLIAINVLEFPVDGDDVGMALVSCCINSFTMHQEPVCCGHDVDQSRCVAGSRG
jgi:hypothetical protein